MNFTIVKTKNINEWRVRIDKYNFKEDWIIFATILGYDNPVDFVVYMYDTYESCNIAREFYRDETTKACSGISGFDIFFSTKKDADKFIEDMVSKL